ncbi:uncharacterized protein LOC131639335 [Vicia villosa]|uniref:uncharacterized protein LOC131639335 n=1 Tax=Vicia villosa TaxID=3911 RepID=UPI00273AF99B|nr:uncharacterized protein LOC131639335 [Vicia villosa]
MQKNPEYNYHSQCEKVKITNLSFADDLLLFARGDFIYVDLMMKTFHSFSAATGLKMNASNCKIYFGSMDENTKQEIKLLTGFPEGPLPFRYLGVPITTMKMNCHHYTGLVKKIVGRITHWRARILSYAGKIQLLKSITFAVTNYWMQCFPLPKHVIHKIDAICRSFMWTGGKEISRKSPISWDKVCRPKCNGGMNLISLQIWNQATLSKLLWSISCKADSLWVRWVHAYYLKKDKIMDVKIRISCSWILKAILKQRDNVNNMQVWHMMR